MKKASPPHNEYARLAALERYGILDTPPDEALDGIAQVAADLCETPIALISLIDPTRQWFKACVGMPVRETSRDLAFCTHAILEPTELMEIEDTTLDERFSDNPLVTGEPMIRFYAGKPLLTPDNHALGTLCVIDDKPRQLSAAQRDGLDRLSHVVIDLLEGRRNARLTAIDQAVEQAARHGVLITDATLPDNPITYANQAIEAMSGYSKAELLGRNCRLLQGHDTDPDAVTEIREAIAARSSCTVVLKNYRKDGSLFWNELTVSPVKNTAGTTLNFVGIQNDVTDRYRVQEQDQRLAEMTTERSEARAKRNRLAQIVEDSVNEIYVSDATTYRILNMNRSARNNLGYTQEESEQLMPWEFVQGLTQENIEELIAPLCEGVLDAQVFVTVHRRKDGSTYPVSTHLQYMAKQTPPVYTAIVQDITESRHQQERIQLLERAIESVDVGVTITDAMHSHHPLVYNNQALCAMTGYSSDELIGKSVRILQKNDQHQPEHLEIQEAQAKGESVQVTLKSTRKDGSEYMDEISLSPVRNAEGELTHYIGVNRDVTSRLDTEARLRQSQKIEAIGQLSGGIAHDFNNMLSVIAGNLEFLDPEITNENQREFLNEASSAAQMGARLTRRLLRFASQGQLEAELIIVNDQVLNAIELLNSTLGDNISLSSSLASDVWQIRADPSEIENTIVNLAINARDAMPSGGQIHIESKNVSITQDNVEGSFGVSPGDYVCLSISDTGCGMTDEVKARIFEPFFTTKHPEKGTGLGLASIYGFVSQSGGHINVNSEVDQGTAFHLYLPKFSEHAPAQEPTPTKSIDSPKSYVRILVVEDNEMVRKVTVKRLHALGFETAHAGTGPEAVQLLESDIHFDLILSDIVMDGGMSGYDLAHWIQNHCPQHKILLTSGFDEKMADESHVDVENLAVLQKPYSLDELQQAVINALSNNKVVA